MPECPNCHTWGNRRSKGCCPKCGAYVYPYRHGRGKRAETIWVLDDPNCRTLVDALRDHIRLFKGVPDFEFAERRPELGMAKTLLDKCGGDQQLALLVIEQYFTRREIWVKPMSMTQILWSTPAKDSAASGCFNIALALAKSAWRFEQSKTTKAVDYMEMF